MRDGNRPGADAEARRYGGPAEIHVVEMEFELFVESDRSIEQRRALGCDQQAIHRFHLRRAVAVPCDRAEGPASVRDRAGEIIREVPFEAVVGKRPCRRRRRR